MEQYSLAQAPLCKPFSLSQTHSLRPASCSPSGHALHYHRDAQAPILQPAASNRLLLSTCPLAGWGQSSKRNQKGKVEIAEQKEPHSRHPVKQATSSQALKTLGRKGQKQRLLSKVRNWDCYFQAAPPGNIACALLFLVLCWRQETVLKLQHSRGCIKEAQVALWAALVHKNRQVRRKKHEQPYW